MLKINKKNEFFRLTLQKKMYCQFLLKVLPFFSFRKKKFPIGKFLQNLHPQLFVQNPYTKVRSICLLTGRSRSVYRSFKMSRLKIREYASQGYFTGLAKASW